MHGPAPESSPSPQEFAWRAASQLDRLREEPGQMSSGTVGKSGFLRLGFERRGDTTILAELDRRVPYLAQRALHPDEALPDLAHVFLITSSGCLLQGDRLALEVVLGPGARAHVTSQSATKIHSMDVNLAVQRQSFTLDEGAYLEFLPEPLIPHRRSRFASDTRITVASSSTLLYAEIVQSGRKHHHPDECFGATLLALAAEARRPDGRLLFAENLVFEPGLNPPRQTGVMDSFDVFGNVILLTPPAEADRIAARVGADVDLKTGVAHGTCRLPNDAGLICKVLGRETVQVKEKVREFWGIVREEVTGAAIPPPHFWR
jgi:urease accessory protein